MLFADLFFMFAFLPICFAAYFMFRSISAKNVVLIIASLAFYAFGEPIKILMFVGSAFLNYLFARWINSSRGTKGCKIALLLCLLYNFGMLGVFKYTDFMINNINAILSSHVLEYGTFGVFKFLDISINSINDLLGSSIPNLFSIFRFTDFISNGINSLSGFSIPEQNIPLPLGISFYTFQIVSYVIDVYWEKVPVQKQFHKLLLYISLFPQLVAGPIVRYQTVVDEIDNRKTTITDAFEGVVRLIIGLSKKVLLANNLNTLVNNCFGNNISEASIAATWIGVIAYAMQVYFDFSGYSDMAIGIGRIFGFHFDENFKHPFMCRSISEFWQRWHISLGSFFRDYLLYVPIFGKRRAVLSLFLVWFTTGLWHGASWNYVIWGLYFGVFIFIETKIGKKNLKNTPSVIMHIYNKLVILIGFGIFKFENISDLGNFFKNLVGANGNILINDATISAFKSHLFIFAIALLTCFPIAAFLKRHFEASRPSLASMAMVCTTIYVILLLFLDTTVLVKTFSSNNPFLYWNF